MPKHEFNHYDNPTNCQPAGPMVLIKTDKISDKYEGTSLIRPEFVKDKEEHAQESGVLIACGPLAWSDNPEPWAQPGQRVIYKRYRGLLYKEGDDKFRIMEDIEIVGVIKNSDKWNENKIDEHRNRS